MVKKPARGSAKTQEPIPREKKILSDIFKTIGDIRKTGRE